MEPHVEQHARAARDNCRMDLRVTEPQSTPQASCSRAARPNCHPSPLAAARNAQARQYFEAIAKTLKPLTKQCAACAVINGNGRHRIWQCPEHQQVQKWLSDHGIQRSLPQIGLCNLCKLPKAICKDILPAPFKSACVLNHLVMPLCWAARQTASQNKQTFNLPPEVQRVLQGPMPAFVSWLLQSFPVGDARCYNAPRLASLVAASIHITVSIMKTQ